MKTEFTIGQKVAVVSYSGLSEGHLYIRTIVAISPKRGDISLDKGSATYDNTGREKGVKYHPSFLESVEQKHYDQIERNSALARIKYTDYEKLTLEELREINKLVQPHFEKQKIEKVQ